MEKRYYRVGAIGILVEGPAFEEAYYLSPFRTEELTPDLTVTVSLTGPVSLPEGFCGGSGWVKVGNTRVLIDERNQIPSARADYDGYGHIGVSVDRAHSECYGSSFLIRVLRLPHRVLEHGSVFLHSSFIEVNGEAILFTADCRTGKSTQAALWEKNRGAFVVNGDRSLLRKENGRWYACGSPYCGTSKICHNLSYPIRAVVILSQAKTNTAKRAGAKEAFIAMLSGCTYHASRKTEVDAVTEIAGDMIASVPFYTLACTPDLRAVEELEKAL
ncbi:MAG: hypothetical protein MJ070_09440 [Lachnospiraceae bacterium]|nr:hypothetical protein [Lachnospiraceae bacterium]